ncbi:leukocyte elastase inhibitor-like [Mixophyes fleayi]|uniref:leukocyte elastase inhibitor-like n=1 Tax=Mixophyes fleayi TaxID=3061075 RepID=UPI003F4DE9A1
MDICSANNQFAIDVLGELSRSAKLENVVFSPLSIITTLSMVYIGARGNTAAQMCKALHFTDIPDVQSECKNLLKELVQNGDGHILIIVEKLFGEKTLAFLPAFLEDTKKIYDASLDQLDFFNNAEQSRQYINDWITQQTKGKIHKLLPEQSISSNTVLVVANTLYFAANWTKQFNQLNTYKAPFTLMSNEQVIVNMMYVMSHFNVKYIKNPGLKVVELPYGLTQDVSMFIILPDSNTVFKQVDEEISLEKLTLWMSNTDMKRMNVAVYLPKFKIEKSFSLKSILSSMGMSEAFSQTKANFSGMTEENKVFVSEVYHKTFLEANEKGTEAASTTAAVMSFRSNAGKEIKADRPFFFFIRHNKSKCILLCGKVHEP